MGVMRALAVQLPDKHTDRTCGQSRGGGFVTSDGVRRSKIFGRVAVTYVQGSPKGGGALGTLGVTNTRLSPVPPSKGERIGMSGLGRNLRTIVGLLSLIALSACSADPALSDENSTANLVDAANLQSDSVETSTGDPRATPITASSIVGNWVLTPKGGDDGKTKCGDFNAPSLYRLNNQTAKVTTFSSDGRYRSFFAYTTPSGEEHSTVFRARWSLNDGKVSLTDVSAQDAFRSEGGSDSWPVERVSPNVITLNSDRYVRCAGAVEVFGEDEPSASNQPTADAQLPAQPTCKSLEPQLAQLTAGRTKRKVIEVDASDKLVDGALSCTGVIITDAGNLYVRFGIEKTPKGQPILKAIWSESPVI
jgi:hypothetical protein